MPNPFLEERISAMVSVGARYGDDYAVRITAASNDAEHRQLVHPFPVRRFTEFTFPTLPDGIYDHVVGLWHRAYGRYAGFRVRCLDDFSTNNDIDAPTAIDQQMALVSTGVYQLVKQYGAGATPLDIGLPQRTIYKPVTGTVKVGVGAVAIAAAGFTVDTTTGQVTFAADKTRSVTGITKAASAVVTVGSHSFLVGESVNIAGVLGMTAINGLRGLISAIGATTITVGINTSGFGTYTGGGVVHTRPQPGEVVTAGCEFDIPVRFDARPSIGMAPSKALRHIESLELLELLDP